MGADLVERDLAPLQQLHQERARDIEYVRGFLRREFGMDRDDADRVALANLGQDIHEQTQRRHRHAHRMG